MSFAFRSTEQTKEMGGSLVAKLKCNKIYTCSTNSNNNNNKSNGSNCRGTLDKTAFKLTTKAKWQMAAGRSNRSSRRSNNNNSRQCNKLLLAK